MVSFRKVLWSERRRPGITSGAWARSMVWIPESRERRPGSRSRSPRAAIIILAPLLPVVFVDRTALELLPPFLELLADFFLLTAFFCLGMILLQQRCDSPQKLFDLDRFV